MKTQTINKTVKHYSADFLSSLMSGTSCYADLVSAFHKLRKGAIRTLVMRALTDHQQAQQLDSNYTVNRMTVGRSGS